MASWIYVHRRFRAFVENIQLTTSQRDDGNTKIASVTKCLNLAYWNSDSSSANSFTIGSWGKGTAVRPPRDVDLYFILPNEVYWRFDKYSSLVNKQSALLQEVKRNLLSTFSRSDIKGDGPVVIAAFTSYDLEVVPAFLLDASASSYWVCDTKNGGSYTVTMPHAESSAIAANDLIYGGKLRQLIQMMKTWQAHCNVPVKSFHLELLATEFMQTWAHQHQSYFFYDWMCRDFFAWLTTKANNIMYRPGTYEAVNVGDAWLSKARAASSDANAACLNEEQNANTLAGIYWQSIFGNMIPCMAQ